MIKKKIKKRFIFIGVGILAIISLVVTLVIILNHKNDNVEINFPKGVHYANGYENAGNHTDVMFGPSFFLYQIDIEEDNYKYGEEFTIEYQFGINNSAGVQYDIEEGDLKITVQAEDFEILSPLEYEYKDFIPENNYIRYDENNNRIYPNKLEIKLKAITESTSLEEILFLVDFNLGINTQHSLEYTVEVVGERDRYVNGWDQYTKDFQLIHQIYYINDKYGTLLGSKEMKNFLLLLDECGCEEDSECNHIFKDIFSSRMIVYRSLNRLYKNNLITKEEYMKNLHWYCQDFSIQIRLNSNGNFTYTTKDFQAEFLLGEEEATEIKKLYNYHLESFCAEIAKRLVTILYEEGKITLEEYEAEMQIIKTKGIEAFPFQYDYIYKLIPFEIDDVNYYREIYVERK